MGAASSSERTVLLSSRSKQINLLGERYCFNHDVTLSLQKKRRAKHRCAALWFGRQQRLLVTDQHGVVVFKVHHSAWAFNGQSTVLDPQKKPVLILSRKFGVVPRWKVRAAGRKGNRDVVWVQRGVFSISPVVRVSITRGDRKATSDWAPKLVVSAGAATKDLAVHVAGSSRKSAVAQLLCDGGRRGECDAKLRVAAGVDVACFVGVLLAADALLHGHLV